MPGKKVEGGALAPLVLPKVQFHQAHQVAVDPDALGRGGLKLTPLPPLLEDPRPDQRSPAGGAMVWSWEEEFMS